MNTCGKPITNYNPDGTSAPCALKPGHVSAYCAAVVCPRQHDHADPAVQAHNTNACPACVGERLDELEKRTAVYGNPMHRTPLRAWARAKLEDLSGFVMMVAKSL